MKRLALIIAPLLLSACIPDPYSMKPEVKIDPDKVNSEKSMSRLSTENPESGDRFDLTHPTELTIRLDANPTTGIWWQDPEFDDSVLELISNDYLADPAPEGVAGSGGTTVMTFKTIAPGRTKIKSEYSRGGGEVYERLSITVKVAE